MKKLFTAILTAILFFGLNAANAQNSSLGGMITFPAAGGPDANAYFIPASTPTDKVLILFHEWWGLTSNIKSEAQGWSTLFDGKVSIYAIDLYDGKTTTEKFEATKLMNNLNATRSEAIINGLLQKIGIGKQIATLGWGMGGSWAFTASAMAGRNAAGCVMYYSYPSPSDARIAQFKTDAMFLLGVDDEYVSVANMKAFSKKVTDAGRGFEFQTFRGANGFANLGSPSMKPIPRMETEKMSFDFLKHKLGLD